MRLCIMYYEFRVGIKWRHCTSDRGRNGDSFILLSTVYSHREEIDPRNREELPFSMQMVQMGPSVAKAPKTALHICHTFE